MDDDAKLAIICQKIERLGDITCKIMHLNKTWAKYLLTIFFVSTFTHKSGVQATLEITTGVAKTYF